MRRRDLLAATAGAPAFLQASERAVSAEVVRLQLRHTWTTVMSSSEYRDNLYVKLAADGVTGVGEGAPIVRYKENAADGKRLIESLQGSILHQDWRSYRAAVGQVFAGINGNWAARSALDIALLDWAGKKLGVPIYQMFGLDPSKTPITTFSIGIDTPEMTRKKVLEAEPFPVLKIKVGLDRDEATIEAVRSVTKKPLRLDANEGFKTKEEAVRKINWLESQGAEFIEQPLPAGREEDSRWVRSRVHIPIFADEAALRARDLPKIADAYDGVVIKLDKTGGITGAIEMIHAARALGMKTMLGCMISSSVSITAAAHISPMVDYADLDGSLLIANDPYRGVVVEKGKLILPGKPGLGLKPA